MSKKIAKELSTEHTTLNPELWNGTVLKSDVRKKLLEIAIAFKEFLRVNVNVVDCVIVGSAANYNWSEHSDIDLHLIVRSTASEVERELYDSKKMLWSNTHEIEINGIQLNAMSKQKTCVQFLAVCIVLLKTNGYANQLLLP